MAEATTSDKFAQVRGFQVEITGAAGKDVDTAWESISCGELLIEVADTAGSLRTTVSPGHKTVNTVTLRGPLTASRSAYLADWLADSTADQPAGRTMTITNLVLEAGPVDTRRFTYHGCLLRAIVWPHMHKSGRLMYDEVCFTYRSEEVSGDDGTGR